MIKFLQVLNSWRELSWQKCILQHFTAYSYLHFYRFLLCSLVLLCFYFHWNHIHRFGISEKRVIWNRKSGLTPRLSHLARERAYGENEECRAIKWHQVSSPNHHIASSRRATTTQSCRFSPTNPCHLIHIPYTYLHIFNKIRTIIYHFQIRFPDQHHFWFF